jgi:hypothetical protein
MPGTRAKWQGSRRQEQLAGDPDSALATAACGLMFGRGVRTSAPLHSTVPGQSRTAGMSHAPISGSFESGKVCQALFDCKLATQDSYATLSTFFQNNLNVL